jgi:hypothetical protein
MDLRPPDDEATERGDEATDDEAAPQTNEAPARVAAQLGEESVAPQERKPKSA